MSYVFGPVPSRRLGMSLGVDLIPPKTCTFDCLYCQVGRTTSKTVEAVPFAPVRKVVEEIKDALRHSVPDTVTLAGSGEPTLHSQIDQVIALIKEVTDIKVALLTNGALFWVEEIRHRISGADIIMPTLSSSSEDTFRTIHRPHPQLELRTIIEGLKLLRQEYRGGLFLEVVFLAGINDTEKEVEGLKTLIDQICPDKIQLNTVVRPPADSRAITLDRKRLEEIKKFFGKNAEVVADIPDAGGTGRKNSETEIIRDMIRRRPLRPVDIASSLGLAMDDVEDLVRGLLIKGYVRKQEHQGNTYYLSNEREVH